MDLRCKHWICGLGVRLFILKIQYLQLNLYPFYVKIIQVTYFYKGG